MRYSVIAAVAAALFALAPLGASAGRGCCSYHGGEAHRCSSDGREICNDGTVSWSCLCNGQVDRSRQRQRYRDAGAEELQRFLPAGTDPTAVMNSHFRPNPAAAAAGPRGSATRGWALSARTGRSIVSTAAATRT